MAHNAAPSNTGGMSSTGRPGSSALPVLLLATMAIRSTHHDQPVGSDDADRRHGSQAALELGVIGSDRIVRGTA